MPYHTYLLVSIAILVDSWISIWKHRLCEVLVILTPVRYWLHWCWYKSGEDAWDFSSGLTPPASLVSVQATSTLLPLSTMLIQRRLLASTADTVCTGVNSGVDVDWFCSNGTRLNLGSSTVAITYSGRLRMSSNRLCSKLCRCSLKVLYCISHEANMQSIPNSGTSKRQTGEGRLNRMCVQSSLCQLWQDLSAKLERNLELLLRVSR